MLDLKSAAKKETEKAHFLCPNDGHIPQDLVTFNCNKCKGSEAIYAHGMYLCPKCFKATKPFRCRLCGNNEVSLHQHPNPVPL